MGKLSSKPSRPHYKKEESKINTYKEAPHRLSTQGIKVVKLGLATENMVIDRDGEVGRWSQFMVKKRENL